MTPALGKPGLVTDEEELEHAAWVAATEEATRRHPAPPPGAASSPLPTSTPPSSCTRPQPTCRRGSRSSAPIERRRIVSFHVDEEPGATEPTDLLWYDVTELADVRALVDQP